jgi:hypothetical protein
MCEPLLPREDGLKAASWGLPIVRVLVVLELALACLPHPSEVQPHVREN